MSDERFVVVATFLKAIEANLACGRLQEEGITANVMGDAVSSTWGGIDGMVGPIELYVPDSERQRAEAILEEFRQEHEMSAREETSPPEQENLWVCSLCGDAVGEDVRVCPACGSSREAVKAGPSQELQESRPAQRWSDENLQPNEPRSPQPDLEIGVDLPSLATSLGDRLADRALKAVVFSLFFATLPTLAELELQLNWFVAIGLMLPLAALSFWLLLKLMVYNGELSASGLRKLYVAVALNVLLVIVLLFMVLPIMFLLYLFNK